MNDEERKLGKEKTETRDGLLQSVHRAQQRRSRQREEDPSVMRFVGQIGVLGWIIVTPILIGLFIGRWIDLKFGTGIFWSAPLMLIGVTIGCWSAWQWMHRQ